MTLNSIAITGTRWLIDGMFVVLIGLMGWTWNKTEAHNAEQDRRIQFLEKTCTEMTTELKYIKENLDEVRKDVKFIRYKGNP